MDLDKYIEIVKDFIKKDYEPWSFYEKQGDELFELQEAIKLVLWYMNDYKNENVVLHKELETWKKIAEKLAILIYNKAPFLFNEECSKLSSRECNKKRCYKCIIEWARKEVEKSEKI